MCMVGTTYAQALGDSKLAVFSVKLTDFLVNPQPL